ncbi:hypothetical protein TIFTF001_044228, partial [Ficus carica]
MRLQWPRFLTKPEPEVPRTPARPGPLHGPGSLHGQDWCHRNIARRSVPTGFNSTLDTAFTNEVSSLAATPDTRWRARAGAPTTPWQRATVSDLPAILDAILWRVGAADCEMWNGHRH